MKLFLAFLASWLSYQSAAAECEGRMMVGPLNIDGYPEVWLAGENGTGNGDHIEIRHNAGMTPFTSCEEEWVPGSMAQFRLLGRKLSFTVDLSNVGCACNLAIYMISSPALDEAGKPHAGTDRQGQPPYYCDANQVGGQWCPEIDVMEANTHAFQATPHRCENPSNGHYSACDRSGCHQNTRDRAGAYGPGDNFTIDTRRKFDVHTDFIDAGGVLAGMRTTIQQQERLVVLDHPDCSVEYYASLSAAMADGMSMRITYWGNTAETMAWMDSPPCGQQACTGEHAGLATVSNMRVTPKIVAKSLTEWQDAQSHADSSTRTPSPNPLSTKAALWPWVSLQQETTTVQPTTTSPQATTSVGLAMVTQAAAKASPKGVSHWVPDTYSPWECHQYVGSQQMTDWCQKVGFQDGYEFQYNGGMQSPCGACWCCKRKAKIVKDIGTTTTHAPPHMAALQARDDLIWVVSDPKDDLFGQIVPKGIIGDAKKFVSLHDRGIAELKEERHFVQRMSLSDYDSRMGKDWAKWLPKSGPCPDGVDGGSDGPCQQSISDPSFIDMLVAKYSGRAPSDTAAAASRWAWPVGPALAIALLLPLAAVATFAVRLFRQHRRPSGGSASRDPEAGSPRSRIASTDSACITGDGPSPLRARLGSTSSAGTPLVPPLRAVGAARGGPHTMQEPAA